jgi:hypothetical protein
VTGLAEGFGSPYNWCDRRCERCPIAEQCPLWQCETQSRWVAEARGEDPDDPEVAMRDTVAQLQRAYAEVMRIAEAEGIDLDAPLPKRPAVLDSIRLQRTASELAVRVHTMPVEQKHEELPKMATLITMKAARIACHLEEEALPDEVWHGDVVPNLLLLQRVLQGFGQALAQLETELETEQDEILAGVRNALGELDRIMQPLIARVGQTPKRILAALIARNAAPSPFCIDTTARTARAKV